MMALPPIDKQMAVFWCDMIFETLTGLVVEHQLIPVLACFLVTGVDIWISIFSIALISMLYTSVVSCRNFS